MRAIRNLFFCLTIAFAAASPASAQFAAQQTWAGTAGGSANAITLTVPNVSSIADLVGVPINFIVGTTNTGAVTVVAGGAASQSLKKTTVTGLSPLTGSELVAGNLVSIMYDGTEYVIQSRPVFSVLPNMVVITSSGTYTPTAGATHAEVYATGAGGGGGGACGGCSGGGGGGGGGGSGATAVSIIPLAGVASVSVTIGTGGGGGAGSTNGSNGGSTLFGSLLNVAGGFGGSATSPAPGGAGGAAVTGQLLIPGGFGQNSKQGSGGDGGPSHWGGQGGGGVAGTINGTSGTLGSGGGAGFISGGTGGSGGPGLVVVFEYGIQ